jgi:alginate lyase
MLLGVKGSNFEQKQLLISGPQITRRTFSVGALAALMSSAFSQLAAAERRNGYHLVATTDRTRILKAAQSYLALSPETITSFPSPLNPGGLHDYFSQADYFWPNPANPDGPYISRDGLSNPANFNGHRKAMIALSIQVPTLTAAWLLTRESRYAQHAVDHLRAWFIASATRMNPNLEFSQGVRGASTGRSYGIIDTLHLAEVARAASLLAPKEMSGQERTALTAWFTEYLSWMKTSDKGVTEEHAKNNHAVCWALQASEFARLIGDQKTRDEMRSLLETFFIPNQLGEDGSFPQELARTKPYSYSIFNFDVMVMLCQSLVDAGSNPFQFALPDGRGVRKAAAFLYPYLKDKSSWPYTKDVEHFDSLPVRSPGLLFSGLEYQQSDYIALWQQLNPDPTDPEIIRNYPVRQPLLWFPA